MTRQIIHTNLTDLGHFAVVNETMAQYFREPYPARVTIDVAALPRGAQIGARRHALTKVMRVHVIGPLPSSSP